MTRNHNSGSAPNQRTTGAGRVSVALVALTVAAILLVVLFIAFHLMLGLRLPWESGQRTESLPQSSVVLPPEPTGPALSYQGFDPSYIIADEDFFNAEAYTEEQVTSFIEKWNEGCRAGSDGTVCMAGYREDSPSFEADQYCVGGFQGASNDSAASIITKAAKGCGINPQVLLTLIQKEQGLITASGLRLDESRYTIATGFACPDETVCDPAYFGFSTQVYYAARQMRKYEGNPEDYMVRPGVPVAIPYAPGVECAGPEVTVQNLASSNLYNYTPYQPNEGALTGNPDQCSTWGNQNFYAMFNAWFGTPEKALESAG